MASFTLQPTPTSVSEFASAPLKGTSDYIGYVTLADQLIAAGYHEFAAAALDDAAAAMEGHPMRPYVRAWAANVRGEARRRAIMAGSIVVSGVLG